MSSSHKYIKDYPRPQLVRENWENLNGEWDFRFDDAWEGESGKWYDRLEADRKITVPFAFETKASGIADESFHPCVWYERMVAIPAKEAGKRIPSHFQAVDYSATLWVNGHKVGTHEGGYAPFPLTLPKRLRSAGRTGLPFEPWTATAVPNRAASAVDAGQLRLLVRADDRDMADGMDGVRESDSYQPGKNNAGAGTRVGKLLL